MKINEIFYSLQGEGRNTGRAAVFVRFSGCNLKCPFCDTLFSSYREMSNDDIVEAIKQYPARLVILTGGEPTLQVDKPLVDLLHASGYEIAMESNGTRQPVDGIDWFTCSPKEHVAVTRCNELKCLFDGNADNVSDHGITADYYYLQPCDVGDAARNAAITAACVEYIKQHPKWRLSLQTHKLIDIK